MTLPFPCTSICFLKSNTPQTNFVFLHQPSGYVLHYDGWRCRFIKTISFDKNSFEEIEYCKDLLNQPIIVESVKIDSDLCYIKFVNGDIFKFFNLMHDEDAPQYFSIIKPEDRAYSSTLAAAMQIEDAMLFNYIDDPDWLQWFESPFSEEIQATQQLLYFKREWDETSEEAEIQTWGISVYYFETGMDHKVVRQLQVFANGNALKYDDKYSDDKWGGISSQLLEPEEWKAFGISQEEFLSAWENSKTSRFPEIVCTPDVLWGQPRLEGRRLAVGDIVSLVNVYSESLPFTLKDFELTMQQVRQALSYCKNLQCKHDNPEKYCHHCLFRVYQTGEAVDTEDPEQPYWLQADRLFTYYFESSDEPSQPSPASMTKQKVRPWWRFW
jgi:uncharacterized protein (DUF433 family)